MTPLFVIHDFDALSAGCLVVAVLGNHVELTYPILRGRELDYSRFLCVGAYLVDGERHADAILFDQHDERRPFTRLVFSS